MNTPAHLLMGLAVFGRRKTPGSGRWAALGSLIPDLSLYVLAGISLLVLQIPGERVFGELYFSDAWQTVFAIDNSYILWTIVLLLALWRKNTAFIALAGAALLHITFDFPLHHDDARQHFWPVSGWVFESPFSYWDSNHHAATIAPLTLILVLVSAVVVWRRWPDWRMRAFVLLVCAAELWVVRQWLLFF